MRKSFFLIVLIIAFQAVAQRTSVTTNNDTIETINIENPAVQDYMKDAKKTYSKDSNYQVSVITKYNFPTKYPQFTKDGSKLYWPQGKKVEWTPSTIPANIKEILITVSENSNYSKPYTFYPNNKKTNSYVIRNLLPNRTYYYKVEEILNDKTVNQTASGVFKTKGQVRMIQVRGCSNVRDLGGWETQYGPRVKYGKMFRSGNLDHITSTGIHDFCDNLNVKAELDLRKEASGRRTKSPMGEDKKYICIPHGGYLGAIKKRTSDYLQDLKWINDRLKENVSVDWHCAIGCDRCGTLTFLIEGLLGLSELDLCRDYELSTFIFSKGNKRARHSIESMISYIKSFGDPNDLKTCFYKYWLSIGANKKDLDYLIHQMLGEEVVIPKIEYKTNSNKVN